MVARGCRGKGRIILHRFKQGQENVGHKVKILVTLLAAERWPIAVCCVWPAALCDG